MGQGSMGALHTILQGRLDENGFIALNVCLSPAFPSQLCKEERKLYIPV